MPFVEVEITQNEQMIREEGVAKLRELLEARGIAGWQPNEADLTVIVLSTVASMVPSVAQIAAVVPAAIFRKYGTELVKTPYNEGAAATVTTKWKLLEEGGKYAPHTIEAGTQLTIGTLAFYVQANVSVKEGESEATAVLVASERGTEYNGLTGTVELVDAISWVKEVLIVGETTGGANQESDEEYQSRLAAALKLQAPRPITAANFAEMALQVPSNAVPAGIDVGRTTAIDGFNPEAHKFKGEIENGKTTVKAVTSFTGVSSESKSLPQIHPGTEVSGTGILAGTTVVSVNEGAKTLILSLAATKTETTEFTTKGSYENQRTVTVFVTEDAGKALSAEAMEAIQDYLEEFRELNFVVFVEPASYNEVRVTTQIHVLPGYTEASVVANVKTALEKYLSPETFGNPTGQTTGANSWLNATQGYNIVRYNTLLGVIEAVPGVQYVFAGSTGLAVGLEEAPGVKIADLTLRGPAPLPETKPANIVVTSA
jgi:hypothetical protein